MKKSKSKFKWILIGIFAPLLLVVLMIMSVGGGAVASHKGYEESIAEAQASNLRKYLESESEEQKSLVHYAREELTKWAAKKVTSPNNYVKTMLPPLYNIISYMFGENKPMNITWDSYLMGYVIKMANTNWIDWSADVSDFATLLHSKEKFRLPEGYIPRKGDIIFFGNPIKKLSDGQTIKAKSCGIVTKVETVVEQTTIKAMRLTVIEGDVEGQIVAGTYNHTTSTTKSYTYDLFDTKGSNHNGFGTSYYPIIGYGTVTTDATETVESTADTSDYKNLYYTIDLQSTYEDAIEAQEEKGETPR